MKSSLSRMFLAAVFAAPLVGCDQSAEIRSYQVPKPETVSVANAERTEERFREIGQQGDPELAEDAIYAAAVHLGTRGRSPLFYTVEVAGDREQLEQHTDEFLEFIQSLRFGDRGFPRWDLPEGWRPQSPRGMAWSFAMGPSDDAPVVRLRPRPMRPSSNIRALLTVLANDWRRRLGRSPIKPGDLPSSTAYFYSDGHAVLAFNLTGKLIDDGGAQGDLPPGHPPVDPSRRSPVAGGNGAGSDGPAPRGPAPGRGPQGAKPEVTFEVPAGWREGEKVTRGSGITVEREAAFLTGGGENQAEVAVTVWPPVAADWVRNVNRWRREAGLAPAARDEIAAQTQALRAGEATIDYAEAFGPERAVAAAKIVHDGRHWVYTLKGPTDVVKQERENFKAFVQSTRFDDADGADDGN